MKKNNLRISILQQAIEGKLVPQLAADGNAQDLVDNIREHKAELIREKKLKKDPNESYIYRDDEGHFMERIGKQEPVCIDENLPFVVPEGWTWARLGEIVNINPRNYVDDNLKVGFIPMSNIEPGFKNKFICDSKDWSEVKSGFSHLKNEDVAFAKITPCFQNRKSVIIKDLPNKVGAGTTELYVLRCYNESISNKYLLLLCKTSYFISNAEYNGTAGQQRVTFNYVNNFLLPLPPLAEQARIVKKVEELMPLAERFEKQSEELELLNGALPGKLRKSILQHAIKGLLVPQLAADGNAQDLVDNIREHKAELIREKKLKKDPNESYIYRDDEGHFMERIGKQEPVCIDNDLPFAVPEGWTWARLGEIGEMTIGKTPPRDCNIYWSNGEFPWVSISDMRDEITSTREKLASTAIPLPPLAEQERIVKKVEELMEKVDKMEKAMV
jgi:type I restriction enzyme S subunit